MPISISEQVGIDPEVFAKTGAFDAILDIDSKLFIDPHLLQATDAPELATSYQKVAKRFEEILHILGTSKRENDVFLERSYQEVLFS